MEHQNSRTPLIIQNRNYKRTTFKAFGGIQIVLGVVSGLLSIAGIAIDGVNLNKICIPDYSYYNYYDCGVYYHAGTFLAWDITCLIFSGWFILTGFFPFCMTEKRRSKWRCLKIAFMVLCIIGASLFIPTVFILGVIEAIIRSNDSGALATLPGIQAVIALTELIVAIVAASFGCCCSTRKPQNTQGLFVVSTNQHGDVMSLPASQIPPHQSGATVYSYGNVVEQRPQQPIASISTVSQPPPYKQ